MLAKQILRQLFALAGDFPFKVVYWDQSSDRYGAGDPLVTLTIHDEHVVDNLHEDYEIGLADAYADGKIDVDGDIGEIIGVASAVLRKLESASDLSFLKLFGRLAPHLRRRSLQRQRDDVHRHYDLGNEFYKLWLDESMCYSCAYFNSPEDSLETAQLAKIDHSLRKVRPEPGETLLDIGCGWGALIRRASLAYSMKALGITLSDEQETYACEALHRAGLSDVCDVKLINYLTLAKQGAQFDKIVSVGMIEHVGQAHLAQFSDAVRQLLKPGGLALLHFITSPKAGPLCSWMDREIFPGAYLPTLAESIEHFYAHNLKVLDIENLRPHYQMTLDRWTERFEANAATISDTLGERFVRMWRLYLRGCSVCFREGIVEVHQVLVSNGVAKAYPLTRNDLYRL